VRQRLLFRRLAKAVIDVPEWDVQLEYAERLLAAQTLRHAALEQLAVVESLSQALVRASATTRQTALAEQEGNR
jgi:hypothetical protein